MRHIFYICDFSLPNFSAYTVHVLKMCESIAKQKNNTTLIVNSNNEKYQILKKKFNIESDFKIISLNKKKNNFFFSRIKNSLKTLLICQKRKPEIIISRHILTSLVLSLFKYKNILEIHTELSGFTKKIFYFLIKFQKIKKNLKFIFIHKNLNFFFNFNQKDFIVLDDAVKLSDFTKKTPVLKNSFLYTGSYLEGKGINFIYKLAKYFKNYKFYLYGNLKTLPKTLKKKTYLLNNLKLNNHIAYSKIGQIISKSEYLLMPYPKKIGVLIDKINVQKYISPLKMFEYLAGKKIIFASYHKTYGHILKHNYNSILLEPENLKKWILMIKKVIKNKKKYKHLKINSYKTAQNYTWEKRVAKIIKFHDEN